MRESEAYAVIDGVFYTSSYTPIIGKALSDGVYWLIAESEDKNEINQKYFDLYLDRSGNIHAPKNDEFREFGKKELLTLLSNYKKELNDLLKDTYLLKINSIQMKVKMLAGLVKEYEIIYEKYFMPNSIRFIKSLLGM